MIKHRPLAALLIPLCALSLAACDAARAPAPSGDPTPSDSDTASAGQPSPDSSNASGTPAPASDGSANDASSDFAPGDLPPKAEQGEKGARDALLSFTRAIEMKEFDKAYALMRHNAPKSLTQAELAAKFDGFGKITVSAPSGTMDGAAGTIYYTAPATITGSNGQKLSGQIILNRVDNVPGATPRQLRWHVYEFDLTSQ